MVVDESGSLKEMRCLEHRFEVARVALDRGDRDNHVGDLLERETVTYPQPRAAAEMINQHGSSVRQPPKEAEAALHPVSAPTLVIWGQGDQYLGAVAGAVRRNGQWPPVTPAFPGSAWMSTIALDYCLRVAQPHPE
jgi:hypothetical protein